MDFIATASRLSTRAEEQIGESTSRFEWNAEGPVTEDVVVRAMEHLGAHSLDASLGGSAWNAIFALANMDTGLSLGYVGVLGRVEAPGLSFLRQMIAFGIDHRMVSLRPNRRAGICLSFIEDDTRVMLTSPCVNLEMVNHINDNFEELVEYLAGARAVHVTSFLDPGTPEALARLLESAVARNPDLLVCFDPGHEWAVNPTEAILRIVRLTRILFVNYKEFKALSSYSHGEIDDVLGRRVVQKCAPSATVFVTKRYDLIEVFSRQGEGQNIEMIRFTYDFADPERDIEDATGAGDVFAAAVVSAILSQRLKIELGAHLGTSLARQKLRHLAANGHFRFPDLTRGYLQSREQEPVPALRRDAVLVAHDGGAAWEPLERFLTHHCAVRTARLTPTDSRTLPSSLSRQQLEESGFAICVIVPDFGSSRSNSRADDRLVHFAGFLQGYLGFEKVALLVQNGCETFSNMAGLLRLDFRPGNIQDAFIELERMLRREGLVH